MLGGTYNAQKNASIVYLGLDFSLVPRLYQPQLRSLSVLRAGRRVW